MANKVINYGPLWNADQPGLTRGEVPDALISSAGQNAAFSRFALIMLTLYAGGCVALYIYVIKPEFDDRWDRSNTTQRTYYDAAIVGYVIVCYLFYFYVFAPILGIKPLNLLSLFIPV
jgi:hypothetical protein